MKWPRQYAATIEEFPRRLVGYWSVQELARLLGVSDAAILMQVGRGKIEPVPGTSKAQQVFFTDEEVARYLSEPYRTGRPRKQPAADPDRTDRDAG